MSFNITPVASGYQEIHPYSAMNIDSVKINTSLIMMKECLMLYGLQIDIVTDHPNKKMIKNHSPLDTPLFSEIGDSKHKLT